MIPPPAGERWVGVVRYAVLAHAPCVLERIELDALRRQRALVTARQQLLAGLLG
jgi:hypothetical protein